MHNHHTLICTSRVSVLELSAVKMSKYNGARYKKFEELNCNVSFCKTGVKNSFNYWGFQYHKGRVMQFHYNRETDILTADISKTANCNAQMLHHHGFFKTWIINCTVPNNEKSQGTI